MATVERDSARAAWLFLAPALVVIGVFFFAPIAMDAALVLLEFLVAVLQAYVFTILSCLYLRDAIHLH